MISDVDHSDIPEFCKYLKRILSYNPSTGNLRWKERLPLSRGDKIFNGRCAGNVAGSVGKVNKYVRVTIDDKLYLAHRLAWLMVYGEFPKEHIDHINHDRADNRLSNLRSVTRKENQRNQSISSNSKSGVMGVYWHVKSKAWEAHIGSQYIGRYQQKCDAVAARKEAERKHGYHPNHGCLA